ncbi:MAG: hypothetical protein M3R06_05510 [Chloroflexota bacterium]|nr:hypothetical protein [Chloroflexota bacterium]
MPEPYYHDEAAGITIYHGRCEDVLPTLDTETVDLVLTDPPFFMPATHYQSRTTWQRSWSDTSVLAAFWSAILSADAEAAVIREEFRQRYGGYSNWTGPAIIQGVTVQKVGFDLNEPTDYDHPGPSRSGSDAGNGGLADVLRGFLSFVPGGVGHAVKVVARERDGHDGPRRLGRRSHFGAFIVPFVGVF